VAAAGSSRANVEADEAAVKQAELNLGYTKITAPIDGIAGFANNQVAILLVRRAVHSRPFHKLIRLKPSLPPAKDRSPILFRATLIRRSAPHTFGAWSST